MFPLFLLFFMMIFQPLKLMKRSLNLLVGCCLICDIVWEKFGEENHFSYSNNILVQFWLGLFLEKFVPFFFCSSLRKFAKIIIYFF